VFVAKKPDSLPQYSQKLGTNVDDKDEEVDKVMLLFQLAFWCN
jgi:hypothetical protein